MGAGGWGTRLRPLTESAAKPLLNVGDKPLLETILESFIEQNFKRFYMAVHYRADMIRDHFGDGGKWDAEIRYIEEKKRLGTAGALRLIPERPLFFPGEGSGPGARIIFSASRAPPR